MYLYVCISLSLSYSLCAYYTSSMVFLRLKMMFISIVLFKNFQSIFQLRFAFAHFHFHWHTTNPPDFLVPIRRIRIFSLSILPIKCNILHTVQPISCNLYWDLYARNYNRSPVAIPSKFIYKKKTLS